MAAQADDVEVRQVASPAQQGQSLAGGDAELVLAQAGGNIGMGLRIHIGVDAQGYRRPHGALCGHLVQHFEFRRRLDVKAVDARLQGAAHFLALFDHAGEHHLRRIAPRGDHALQFAHRDNIETGALARQHIQHGQVRVGFHGIAHQVLTAGQRPLILAQRGLHRGAGIHVGRGAQILGEDARIDALDEQSPVAVFDTHERSGAGADSSAGGSGGGG